MTFESANGNGSGNGRVHDYTPLWPMVPGTRKISVTINGTQVEAEEGQTILQACRVLGIEIPTLCYEPKLAPYGACRICAVEVAGPRRHADQLRHRDRGGDGHHHPLRAGDREPPDGPRAHLQRPRRVLPAALPVQVPDPRRHSRLPEAEHARQLGGGDAHPEALAAVPGHPRPRVPRPVRGPLPARGGRHRDRHPRLPPLLRRPGARGRRAGADPVAEGAGHRAQGGRHRRRSGRHGRRLLPPAPRPPLRRLRGRARAGRHAALRDPAVPAAEGVDGPRAEPRLGARRDPQAEHAARARLPHRRHHRRLRRDLRRHRLLPAATSSASPARTPTAWSTRSRTSTTRRAASRSRA